MNEIIYSVFVSSTFEDLREERGELQKALLKLKCFPIGMELFPSSDDETWDFIKRQIDHADYYVVVIAGRYGSVGPDGISYTEMEYDYARSIGKPTVAFLHSDPGKIPAERTEMDPGKREKLDAFRRKVRRSVVTSFSTPHELALHVFASITELKDSKPAIGYVRANQTVDPRKYADILEENARLREEITKLQPSEIPFLGAEDQITIDINISDITGGNPQIVPFTTTLGNLFMNIAESIFDAQCSDSNIENMIKNLAHPYSSWDKTSLVNPDRLKTIRRKLFGVRLIELQLVGQPDYRQNEWSLTDYGRAQYDLLSRLNLQSAGKSDS
jgi:hypothetical protein